MFGYRLDLRRFTHSKCAQSYVGNALSKRVNNDNKSSVMFVFNQNWSRELG